MMQARVRSAARRWSAAAGAVLLAGASVACESAARNVGQKVPPVNADREGVALHGYDPVSYFEQERPSKGSARIEYRWRGATWRFASEEHRDRFAVEPERYAPQYGGYCAKAVSENHIADVDPFSYKVVDGKLYLNYSPKVQKLWEEDIPGRIARADSYWPGLQLEPAG